MPIDKTKLDQLLSMDDATLAKTIEDLCKNAGIGEAASRMATRNLRAVRRGLQNASDEDLAKLIAVLGRKSAHARPDSEDQP